MVWPARCPVCGRSDTVHILSNVYEQGVSTYTEVEILPPPVGTELPPLPVEREHIELKPLSKKLAPPYLIRGPGGCAAILAILGPFLAATLLSGEPFVDWSWGWFVLFALLLWVFPIVSYTMAYRAWARRKALWDRLYYCFRDDVVFLPETGAWSPATQLNRFIGEQIRAQERPAAGVRGSGEQPGKSPAAPPPDKRPGVGVPTRVAGQDEQRVPRVPVFVERPGGPPVLVEPKKLPSPPPEKAGLPSRPAAMRPTFHNEKEALAQIREQATALAQAVAAAEAWYRRYTEDIERQLQQSLADAQNELDRTVSQFEGEHRRVLTKIGEQLAQVQVEFGSWALPWEDATWATYQPGTEIPIPYLTRLGTMKVVGQCHSLDTVALLPIIGGRNVVIKAAGAAKSQAVQVAQSLVLRLLLTTPPAKLRLLLIDPVGLGQNVAGFMHLADYAEELVGGKAWTEPQHIEKELAALSSHMELVIQKYLRNRYRTMEAYNAEAGEVAEPYRLLVAVHFPVNFTAEAARRLISITTNGPRCGVYALVLVDTEQPLPHGFNPADLERTASVIAWDGQRFVWQDDDFRDALLSLDNPPALDQFERLVHLVGQAAKEAGRVEVSFARVVPPRPDWWKAKTSAGLQVALGRAGARQLQYLSLGEGTAQHALVAGRTGAGKSNLMHVLITGLALTYPPEELQLYLVDFKKGVEFKRYATHNLPHVRVIAIETEREFGLSVLRGLDGELQRRGELFRKAGCNDLAEYRHKSGQRMPRILLLVDEFQEFFTEDDALASEAAVILDRLARQGRAFGMHVLLGSQTLAGAYSLARSTMDQMAVRIALQCSDADSRLILAEDNPGARLLSRPGEAIYNAASGLVEGNNLFQIAWLPDEDQELYLGEIEGLARAAKAAYPSPIVFEGHEPANLEKCEPLVRLLSEADWPAPARSVDAWLGEPVAIRPPTAARFRRQAGSHLLIVGRDEGAAIGMLTAALLSLAAQHRPEHARFEVVDLTTAEAAWAELPEHIADALPHTMHVLGRRDVPGLLDELVGEVHRRQEMGKAEGPTIYLLIQGLHRARDLRQEEMGYPFGGEETPPSPARQFVTVLQEGPEVGIHVLAWCDTYASLTRVLDRRGIGEFTMRVALPMSSEDSTNLLDDPAASRLDRPHRAIFYDEEQVGRLDKFRPYAIPPQPWLEEFGRRLRKRRKG